MDCSLFHKSLTGSCQVMFEATCQILIFLSFSFRNPVNVTLTDCMYMVEGPGDVVPKAIKYRDVPPLEEVSIPVSFTTGRRTGARRIVVTFTSRQLPQISGSHIVNIVGR